MTPISKIPSVVSVAENIRKSQVSGKMYSMGGFSFWVSCFAHSLILQKLFMNIQNRIRGNFGLLKGIQNFDFLFNLNKFNLELGNMKIVSTIFNIYSNTLQM